MPVKILIILSLLVPMIGISEGPVDPAIRAMTEAQRTDTVIPKGVLIRSLETPGAVFVGDGETPGGARIGDGAGWQEGSMLTQDLKVGDHKIILGAGYELVMLGGWGLLQGQGVVGATTNGTLSAGVFGQSIIKLTSAASLITPSAWGWNGALFYAAVPVAEAVPQIQFTRELLNIEWATVPLHHLTTNGSSWTLYWAADTNSVGNYRIISSTQAANRMDVFGDLTVSERLKLTAIPTATDGLPTGSVWCDTNDLNRLKIVTN